MNSISGAKYARLEYSGLKKHMYMQLLENMNIYVITELYKDGLLNPENNKNFDIQSDTQSDTQKSSISGKELYCLEKHIENVKKKYKVELLKYIIESE
jgi:hypothetical protein